MTLEEKAKAYDEALGRAKRMFSNKEIEYLFPELAESEDEKIRKDLLTWLKSCEGQTLPIDRYDAAIAWLEKQRKPEVNERAWLYLVADVLTWDKGIGQYLDNPRVKEFAKKLSKEYSGKFFEQKPTEWSEEDETGWTNTMIMIKECATNHYTKGSTDLVINWLKSLKGRCLPKSNWKPTEKQIAALEWQLNNTDKNSWQYRNTKELYDYLKTLLVL